MIILRTKSAIKNISSTFVSYIILGILGFVKIKIFVKYLSNDMYSLNQLFFQILGYLSLADAGFGVLIVQKMYKAFATDDQEEINNIYSSAKIFFKKIGYIILGVGVVVSFVVHYFTKAEISNLYIQLLFIVFLIRNVVDYFFYAPRYVISADQKMYKITYMVNSIRFFQIIVDIVLVMLKVDFLIVLIPGIFISIILNCLINKVVYNQYSWLKDNHKYEKKYLKGTSDIISQKISGIMYSNTDIVLLSTFVDPFSVIVYSSYNYIIKYVNDTSYILADAIIPSFANALIDEKNEKKFEMYSEFNILFYFIAAFFAIMFYLLLNPFIKIWVGNNYVVNTFSLSLFILTAVQFVSARANYAVVNSLGLFKETKKIIQIEAFINMITSLVLVNFMGINGVLIGTIVSTYCTTFWYIPLYLYKKVFNEKVFKHFGKYLIFILIILVMILLLGFIQMPNIESILSWLIFGGIYSIIVLAFLFSLFYILFKDFRNLVDRGKYFLLNKFCKNANT